LLLFSLFELDDKGIVRLWHFWMCVKNPTNDAYV